MNHWRDPNCPQCRTMTSGDCGRHVPQPFMVGTGALDGDPPRPKPEATPVPGPGRPVMLP